MQAGCMRGGSRGPGPPPVSSPGGALSPDVTLPRKPSGSSGDTWPNTPGCILGLTILGQCGVWCVCMGVCGVCACVEHTWHLPVCPEAPAPFLVASGMQQVSLGDPLLSSLLPTCLVPSSRSEFPHGPLPAGLLWSPGWCDCSSSAGWARTWIGDLSECLSGQET